MKIKYDTITSKPLFSVLGLSLLILSNLMNSKAGVLILIRGVGLILILAFLYSAILSSRYTNKRVIAEGLNAVILYLVCMLEGIKIGELLVLISLGFYEIRKYINIVFEGEYAGLYVSYLGVFIITDIIVTVIHLILKRIISKRMKE